MLLVDTVDYRCFPIHATAVVIINEIKSHPNVQKSGKCTWAVAISTRSSALAETRGNAAAAK